MLDLCYTKIKTIHQQPLKTWCTDINTHINSKNDLLTPPQKTFYPNLYYYWYTRGALLNNVYKNLQRAIGDDFWKWPIFFKPYGIIWLVIGTHFPVESYISTLRKFVKVTGIPIGYIPLNHIYLHVMNIWNFKNYEEYDKFLIKSS